MEFTWIEKDALLLLHEISLSDHGGGSGLRDEGLLISALARPRNLVAYGEPDVAALAAAYAFGLARNHAFVDGNKRAAFLALGLFLDLNGYSLEAGQPEAVATVMALAAGEMDEQALAAWVREHMAAL